MTLTAQRWSRWAARSAAGALVLAILLAVVVHLPPVRRVALRRAIALLEQRFDVVLRADGISYNAAALRVRLTGVTVAAVHDPATPFLTARAIEATLPWTAVRGRFALEQIRFDAARVAVVHRRDGTSNLPRTRGSPDGEPPALPIGRLTAPQLAVSITNEPGELAIDLPSLALDVGNETGSVRLASPGRIRRGTTDAAITQLAGLLAFDGRVATLSRVNVTADRTSATLDGTLAFLVEDPRAELRFAGRGDLPELVQWGTDPAPFAGSVAFDGTIAGPFSALTVDGRVRGDAVRWESVRLTGATASVSYRPDHVTSEFAAAVAGGRVRGRTATVAEGDTTIEASWTDVDAADALRTFAPEASVLPAARSSGQARLQGRGSDLAGWTIDADARFEPVRGSDPRTGVRPLYGGLTPRPLPLGGAARLRSAGGRWQLRGDPVAGDIPLQLDLSGAVNDSRFAASTLRGTMTVRDADVSRLLATLRRAGIDVPADVVTAGRVEATATVAGTLAQPRFSLTARGGDLVLLDVTDVDADITADGTSDAIDLDTRLRRGANEAQFSGRVLPDARRLDGRVTARITELAALFPDVPAGGIIDLQFDATGPFDAVQGRGTVAVADASYGQATVGDVRGSLVLDAAALSIDAVVPAFRATVKGRLGRGDRTAILDVEATGADLQRLATAIAPQSGLAQAGSGTVSFTAHAEGRLDRWRDGSARVDVSQLVATTGDLIVRLADPARASYAAGTIDVESLEALAGDTRLSVDGRLPAFAGSPAVPAADALRAVVVGDVEQVLTTIRATRRVDLPPVAGSGPVALLARVTGSAEEPSVSADLELGPGALAYRDLPAARNVEVRAHVENGRFDLVRAVAEWEGSRATAGGSLPLALLEGIVPAALARVLKPPRDDQPPATRSAAASAPAAQQPATFHAQLTGVTARVLAPFLDPSTLSQVEGVVDASLNLQAPSLSLASVEGEVRLDRLQLRVAGLPVEQRTPTRVVFDDGFARVAAWDWTGQGAELGVRGQVRLADRQAGLLADGRIDLRMLTPFVREAGLATAGTLIPRLSITGPLDDPRLNGEMRLTDGELRVAAPRLVASDVSALAVLVPRGLQLVDLRGSMNGGTVTGEGELTSPNDGPLSTRLTTMARSVAVEFPDGLRSEVDADLTLALAGPDGTLSGVVTVTRSAYREPLSVVNSLLDAVRAGRLVAETASGRSALDRLALNVRVVTDSDVVVDNNIVRLELGGDVRLIGTVAAPAMSGRAVVREGGELFLGRNRYTIESGTIDFANPATIEPNLTVQARTRAGGQDIDLTLKGTPDDLDVDLSAPDDPLLGEVDIASLLLTGRVLKDVPGDEARIVGEQALGYLSGDLLGAASRIVGLDIRLGGVDDPTLRRDAAAIASEADPTSRVTFGKSFRDRLDLTLSQSLRDGDAQTWIVDYQPFRQVNLRLVSNDDNLRAYEFRHDVSIGAPPVLARPASTRSAVEALRIGAIRFGGDTVVAEAELRAVLRLTEGDRFDVAGWQRDRDDLTGLLQEAGFLEGRVAATRADEAGGVTLTYTIEPGPRTRIDVAGVTLPAATMAEIETAWSQMVFGDFLIEEAREIVRRELARQRYLAPEVTATLASATEPGAGARTLTITVTPGPRAARARVVVNASEAQVADDLMEWLREQRLEDTAWREPETVQRALAARLRSRGYLAPRITVAPPALEGDAAVVLVTVEEGSPLTVGAVTFPGARMMAATELATTAALTPGAPYDPEAVDEAADRVAASYRRAGFGDARVSVQPVRPGASGAVDVALTVAEGRRQVLREIDVQGNRAIDTDVITRALGLTPGEPLGTEVWLQARARVFDTALFRRVDVAVERIEFSGEGRPEGRPLRADGPASSDVEADLQVGPIAEQPMRVRVVVQEWPTLRLRYGFQLSEERPEAQITGRDLTPGFSADLTRRTLFGRAITVGGAAQYQRRERLGRLFVNGPTMFGLPIESLLALQQSREEQRAATLVTEGAKLSWEQRVKVAEPLRLSYSYSFERDHTYDTNVRADSQLPEFDITVNIARLTASAVYDTRNDALDAARGWLLSSNIEYASESLGSDLRFVRHLAQAHHFYPWRRMVVASSARVGTVTPLDDQLLIPSERFYAGGARTVRGVAEDTLGARDFFDEPAGGGGLVVLNQELRFPVYGWFRGVAFVDAGNVFATPSDIRLGELTGSFGGGLRLATPFALIRADYGRLWSPAAGQRGGRWTFGIGHTF